MNGRDAISRAQLVRHAPTCVLVAAVFAMACDRPHASAQAAGPWPMPAQRIGKPCASAVADGAQVVSVPPVTIDDGPLLIVDASAVGGPTVPGVRLDASATTFDAQLVVDTNEVVCVALRRGQAPTGAPLVHAGHVVLDTDTLLIADERRAKARVQRVAEQMFVALEVPSEDVDRLKKAVAADGMKPYELGATLLHVKTDAPTRDLDALRRTVARERIRAHVFLEPGSPGLSHIVALGSRRWTMHDGDLLVDGGRGLGAYPVWVARDNDRLMYVEIRLGNAQTVRLAAHNMLAARS